MTKRRAKKKAKASPKRKAKVVVAVKAEAKAKALPNGMKLCTSCERYARQGRAPKQVVYRGRWFCKKCWDSWDEKLPSKPVESAMAPGNRYQKCPGPPEILVISLQDIHLPAAQELCRGKYFLHPDLHDGFPVWWRRVGVEECRFIYKDKDVGWMISDRTPTSPDDDDNNIFFANFDVGCTMPNTCTGTWLRFYGNGELVRLMPGKFKVSPIRRFFKTVAVFTPKPPVAEYLPPLDLPMPMPPPPVPTPGRRPSWKREDFRSSWGDSNGFFPPANGETILNSSVVWTVKDGLIPGVTL